MPKQTPGEADSGAEPVLAAGAVLWRRPGDVEVAVIHRPRYDDWSLPKGKVNPGESEPVTAVREIHEETGFRSRLGRWLATVSYPIPQGRKRVVYWSARADESTPGEFVPNKEVDKLLWLSPLEAIRVLSYPHDRKVVRRFTEQPADTRSLLIVRHGTAGSKSRYKGDDRLRPLDKRGRAQAEALVGVLLAFGATDLHAADRLRCRQTLEPLAEELGADIRMEPALTEEAYAEDPEAARQRMVDIAAEPGTRVICSQGKVIPNLVDWWCTRDGVDADRSRNRKGSTWVMTLHDDLLVAADHIGSPLPTRA
ncbi:8-oxo-(d)GTP phosphatase MutT1 [Mycolicibacterium palauense]|uniref:NUDIX hydrolase n=1 Tax=Mycolicibacterium palauense TaxID=2034511 RepID=UPI000BFEB56F|nr:NUDIX hydrolase [Mycolicibacterium palauense]